MKIRSLICAFALIATIAPARAHDHLAVGTDSNGKLELYDGTGAAMTNPNVSTVYHLIQGNETGTFPGYYSLSDQDPRVQYPTDGFVFIAYSDGQVEYDGTNHAKTGANIWCEITSVTGPAGAHFGFWDNNWEYYQTTPTKTFATNSPTGGWKFTVGEPLSEPVAPAGAISDPYYEGAGTYCYMIPGTVTTLKVNPGEDPYGHIHDRGFTVDQPGDYYVGFTFYDLGGNGGGGGPLNATSQTYTFHFQAVDPTAVPSSNGVSRVLTMLSVMATGAFFVSRRELAQRKSMAGGLN